MKRGAITLLVLAIGCSRSAADHEELGDREYAKGSYRDALAEYQLGLKAHETADLHAKTAAAALHTQDYALAAAGFSPSAATFARNNVAAAARSFSKRPFSSAR